MLDVGPDAHDHAQEASVPPSDPRRQGAPAAHEEHHGHLRHEHPRWSVGRVAFLAISAICIYLFAPSIAEVFSAYDRLGDVEPIWLLPAVLCALGSFACVWLVQAIALGTRDWFSVVTTQLAGNAFNRITPGGGATGTALQANMLADAGFGVAYAATALTVQSVLSTAAIVALPVFALPFVLFGTQVPDGLLQAFWIGIPVFLLMVGDRHRAVRRRPPAAVPRPGHRVGALQVEARRVDGSHARRRGCSRAAIASGGEIGPAVAGRARVRRWRAGCSSTACSSARCAGCRRTRTPRWCCWPSWWRRCSACCRSRPAASASSRPGLAATLAVAGISTGDALVATLVYRMLTFWLPIPLGGVAAYVFRRRHPHQVPAGAAPATPS